MPSAPTLVILAAGAGSRFGGVKQLAGVGPHGETLLDYAVHDARRTGFGRVVLVVSPGAGAAFAAGDRAGSPPRPGRGDTVCVEQRLADLPDGLRPPAGRTRPWGTGQAVLAAAPAVDGPFAVVNADDFYGAEAFRAMARFLAPAGGAAPPPAGPPVFGMIAYRLGDTLSDAGAVSRAVCPCDPEGWLQDVEEILAMERCGEGGLARDGDGGARRFPPETPVSRNFWGLTPAVFPLLEEGFARFLADLRDPLRDEYLLPARLGELLRARRIRVRALPGGALTFGMTYRDDLAAVRARIAELIAAGDYPRDLDR